MFRILIDDGMQIELGTGIGRYSSGLYKALKQREEVQVDLINWKPISKNRKINRIEYLCYLNSKKFQSLVNLYDAVIFTNYAIPLRRLTCKVMGCIPDMVSFKYPKTLPPAYCFYNTEMIRNTVHKADIVMTISKSVKNEIEQYFPEFKSKIVYTWLGIDKNIHKITGESKFDNKILSELKPRKYFLFVSTIERRKNIGLVLEAFVKLKRLSIAKEYKIVFAGKLGYGGNDYVNYALDSDYAKDIVFPGYVSNSDLNHLYNEAAAFVFPTLYEGFGFAQIECMAVGLPIILSDIPVNREVSRDYGMYFNTEDCQSLVDRMIEVINGNIDRQKLKEIADSYLRDFSWERIAQQYIEILMK